MTETNLSKKKLIYLTGFMGSGKSTLAPMLANVLGFDSLDIDKEIERTEHQTISSVFKERGETYFRNVEREILEKASALDYCVVALGGGTITFSDNLTLIKNTGLLVYLNVPAETIFQRVKKKENRPLLQDSDGKKLSEEALQARIQTLLEKRSSYYSQADIIIEINNSDVGITVDQIANSVKKFIAD